LVLLVPSPDSLHFSLQMLIFLRHVFGGYFPEKIAFFVQMKNDGFVSELRDFQR